MHLPSVLKIRRLLLEVGSEKVIEFFPCQKPRFCHLYPSILVLVVELGLFHPNSYWYAWYCLLLITDLLWAAVSMVTPINIWVPGSLFSFIEKIHDKDISPSKQRPFTIFLPNSNWYARYCLLLITDLLLAAVSNVTAINSWVSGSLFSYIDKRHDKISPSKLRPCTNYVSANDLPKVPASSMAIQAISLFSKSSSSSPHLTSSSNYSSRSGPIQTIMTTADRSSIVMNTAECSHFNLLMAAVTSLFLYLVLARWSWTQTKKRFTPLIHSEFNRLWFPPPLQLYLYHGFLVAHL